MKLRDISETFENDLCDPEFMIGYLEDALADGLPSFLIALKDVIKANKNKDFDQDNLDKIINESEIYQFLAIDKSLHSLGLKLSLTSINK